MTYQICTECYAVQGVGTWHVKCYPEGSHILVEAVVVDCPHLERTAKGRVTRRRRDQADEACLAAPDAIGGGHHYGDGQRRHFMTPDDAEAFNAALAQAIRITELETELAALRGSANV